MHILWLLNSQAQGTTEISSYVFVVFLFFIISKYGPTIFTLNTFNTIFVLRFEQVHILIPITCLKIAGWVV